jgi:hypothetical protein
MYLEFFPLPAPIPITSILTHPANARALHGCHLTYDIVTAANKIADSETGITSLPTKVHAMLIGYEADKGVVLSRVCISQSKKVPQPSTALAVGALYNMVQADVAGFAGEWFC